MEKAEMKDANQFNEERFTKIDIIKSRKSSAFLLNFLPEQHMKPHSHPDRELYLHVLKGNGIMFVDDADVEVTEGDVVHFNSKEQVGFTNTSADKVVIYGVMTLVGE